MQESKVPFPPWHQRRMKRVIGLYNILNIYRSWIVYKRIWLGSQATKPSLTQVQKRALDSLGCSQDLKTMGDGSSAYNEDQNPKKLRKGAIAKKTWAKVSATLSDCTVNQTTVEVLKYHCPFSKLFIFVKSIYRDRLKKDATASCRFPKNCHLFSWSINATISKDKQCQAFQCY